MKQPERPPDFKRVIEEMGGETLIKMIQDDDLNQRLKDLDAEYPYWEKFRYKVANWNYNPEFLWTHNKFSREMAAFRIHLDDIRGFDFKFNVLTKTLKSLHHFDLHMGGLLEGRSIIPSDDRNRYLISSIMEEAIASSQLEGAATTREIAKEMLRSNRKPQNHSEKMIVNNYLTINKVVAAKNQPLTRELILDIHATISKDTLKDPKNEGRFRDNNNVDVVDGITGEVFYTPPTHEHIEKLMESFCRFANEPESKEFIHPIIRGILLHFLIGYIHPFVDGNGRTARALFYWYLLSKGYWLVEYMSISKVIIKAPSQYARAYLYAEHDDNDLTYFIDYNLKCMELSLQSLQQYIDRKVIEKQNLMHLVRHEQINERQAELLKNLIVDNQKSFTISEIQNKFGVVYQTARTDLAGLTELGYLVEKKMGKRLIYFKAPEFETKLERIINS